MKLKTKSGAKKANPEELTDMVDLDSGLEGPGRSERRGEDESAPGFQTNASSMSALTAAAIGRQSRIIALHTFPFVTSYSCQCVWYRR